ncbi:MAG: gamma carbonic anhydrase family protein [Christensenellaceae bacterium]|nr:gamma carbonic anhydrase family protein [Christensenellaceae bacterium]
MIKTFQNKTPEIHESAYIDETSKIIGDVEIGENSSVWCGTVIRGDLQTIKIGKNCNIQDNAVLHTGYTEALDIGDNTSVGHMAVLHGCTIKGNCVIGIGAVIMNGAVIGKNCIIGAGSLIPPGKVIEDGSVTVGNPFKIIRKASEKDLAYIKKNAQGYVELKEEYKKAELK